MDQELSIKKHAIPRQLRAFVSFDFIEIEIEIAIAIGVEIGIEFSLTIRFGVFLNKITSSIQSTEYCGDAFNSTLRVQVSYHFDFDLDFLAHKMVQSKFARDYKKVRYVRQA